MVKKRLITHEGLAGKGITYSKSRLARLEKLGKFPKRVLIGPGKYGYVEDEVDALLEAKIAERDAEVAAEIVQREEHGLFQLGWHDDAAGPFESRKHAADVAAQGVIDADTA
jgi:prophage regulatory protein